MRISHRSVPSIIATIASLTVTVTAPLVIAAGTWQVPQGPDPYAGLRKDAYMYQQAEMENVNWLYLGFAPRMFDPARIKVIVSKRGYTMRVRSQFNKQEIADYPLYLIDRKNELEAIIERNQVSIPQFHKFEHFRNKVSLIEQNLAHGHIPNAQASLDERYQFGLELLKTNFPDRVFVENAGSNDPVITLHMVYPVTTLKDGMGWPEAKSYTTYSFEEHRAVHNKYEKDIDGNYVKVGVADYLFSGFPTFWFDRAGRGTGIHGPIRYSRPNEPNQSGPYGNTEEEIQKFWDENHFLPDQEPRLGLTPILRWDLVRTNNSAACFRSESVELRHLLPAETRKKTNNDQPRLMAVEIIVTDEFDSEIFDAAKGREIINVDYYVVNPFAFPDKERWFRKHYLTAEEQKLDRKKQRELVQTMLKQTRTFSYMEPNAFEFTIPEGTAAPKVQAALARAPKSFHNRYCSEFDRVNAEQYSYKHCK